MTTSHPAKRVTAGTIVKKAALGVAAGAGLYALASAIAFEFTIDTKSPISIFAMKKSGRFKVMQTPSDFTAEAAAWFHNQKHSVYTDSTDGKQLHAWKFEPFDSTPRPHQYVLCIHGYMGTPTEMQPWAYHFAMRGFTILVPWLSGEGLQHNRYTGMTYTESLDTLDWINYIIGQDPQAQILLDGTSMGGSTVILAAGDHPMPSNVKAILCDSAFDSPYEEMIGSTQRNTHLPRPIAKALVNGVDVINRMVQGFSFKDISITDAVSRITLPIQFLQGADDKVVPKDSIMHLYDACPSTDKRQLVIPGAAHVYEVLTEPELYWTTVDSFVDDYFPAPQQTAKKSK
ncbi:alpha/beta hydrolase [Bifidobacterium gallicum]|uniref:Alpha/beta superfamily hydrolase n=1 Tax=Bifidobacterium gallicum DSM 20093 = LMG 11596 TaxID=561180 RepID=D1NSE4_9BIFI|nr:alpha/beta fold hydrolase [Bifidobacterium gallicum]EFA23596.1 hypothetical protein BIFGAL_02701 [Bifidobacterium gallicum DSM 20093 = LMG 11596]KFI58663.1 alpha/beta superfamily hydrolase [Bifidobacterium gallicum DSM 20093 = LMG 11596]